MFQDLLGMLILFCEVREVFAELRRAGQEPHTRECSCRDDDAGGLVICIKQNSEPLIISVGTSKEIWRAAKAGHDSNRQAHSSFG